MVDKLINRTILQGDVLDKIKELPEESIDCIISSPPYPGDSGITKLMVSGDWNQIFMIT